MSKQDEVFEKVYAEVLATHLPHSKSQLHRAFDAGRDAERERVLGIVETVPFVRRQDRDEITRRIKEQEK